MARDAGDGAAQRSGELSRLLTRIAADAARRQPPQGMRTRIVGVDGPGGAGKTTFASHLAAALGGCDVIHTDDFASWDNPVDWWADLIVQVLEPISRGEPARFRPTAWSPDRSRDPIEVVPSAFLVLEGVTASRQVFRAYLTYTIWIDASAETRLQRGLARDGDAARAQWEAWMAGEDRYRERERPDLSADLAIDGERDLWR